MTLSSQPTAPALPKLTAEALTCPLLLTGAIQNYAWGKPGTHSLVSKYAGIGADDATTPYAELWFGTHPKGNTLVQAEGSSYSLAALIAEYPAEVLGQTALRRFGPSLPFLFKVLSIAQALSIQAHPSKSSNPHAGRAEVPAQFRHNHAGYLHWKDPKNYPDANHKPEIAIALTELAMLNGFKPLPELLSTFEQIPELAACMPTELLSALRTARTADQQQLALRELYRALLLSELPSRKAAMQRLRQRLPEGVAGLRWELPLLQQMFENYGEGDVGVPTALLMNWLKIPAGAAVFIGPNQLHAYLQGDILECMANSDNVVRAGLTPKFQDTQELLAMAAVVPGLPSSIQPTVIAESTICKRYPCPAEEFCVQQILGDAGQSEKFSRDSVSLLLCTSGRIEVSTKGGQHTLTEGQLVLLPATAKEFRVTLHGGQAAAYASPVVPQGVLVGVGDARSEA